MISRKDLFSLSLFSILIEVWVFPAAVIAQTSPPDIPCNETSLLSTYIPPVFPLQSNHSLGPILSAKSVIALDIDSGAILYEKNVYERLPIASITKIMTAVVTLENIQDLEQEVSIPKQVSTIVPSKMNLLPGDVLSIHQLLLGALIHSANDAAYVLSTLLPDFMEQMNKKAHDLHLLDSHFSNPIGWDEDENYSSAYDLSKLMLYALQKPLIYEAISTQKTTITSQKGRIYKVENTNQLFGSFLDEIGGKTGTTDNAGPSLINIFRTANKHRIMTIVLNSKNRYAETKILSFWIMKNFEWK
jgi:D-alanyl-D-alanine carboxypeptidase (penicillin-binding protein 5/6)